MSKNLTIVVTGSNRGIGQGIIQLLAKTQHTSPLTIIATSRSGSDLGVQASPPNEVRYGKLDIGDQLSIKSFFSSIKDVDVLINNAGINNNNQETPDLAEQVIDVNYRGTRDMCQALLSSSPSRNARIVNVSSTACQLNDYSAPTASKFRSVKSIQDVDSLADQYIHAVKQGADAQKDAGFGSPPKSYQVSKALINALTVVLARENSDVVVGRPPKTLEEGARIPVRLAIGELGAGGDKDIGLGTESAERISGRYFGNEGVTDRGWGRVRKW
ncbi:NAD(P)-binding protein [Macroventuria anomochaeta]|uniref:NAD(P)-binding protein n=1 Tax=Macroventuria anomochaeta TaxID=301207 RepID=A0ACB6SGZ6_9PLEO|nr:NAD(P)-binding protein [Macroventuria anomochaeta]KAF2633570.1 NAD(P)-binding protein [Macroventuria anomochaeta]